MKVLVVEDDKEMHEALCDVLQQNGHRTASAFTAEDAKELSLTFAPEIILWDADVGKGELPEILRSLSAGVPRKLYIFAFDETELIGTSNTGWIRKPFKSADILSIVGKEEKEKDKEKGQFLKNLMNRNENQNTGVGIDDMGLKFGTSYVFFESEPVKLRKGCRQLSKKEDEILYITSGNVKAVRELIRKDGMTILALSEKEGKNYLNGSKIGSVANRISTFIGSAKRPVIVFDDIYALIDMNDLSSVLTMIGQTIRNSSDKQITMLLSLDECRITEKGKELLLKHLIEYR